MTHFLPYAQPKPIRTPERAELLEFAKVLARLGGAEALPFFRSDLVISNKLDDGRFDPVTAADQAVERKIRWLIDERFPEHGLLGEEFGDRSGNGLTWVIDPIDGTRAFMSGLLHWGVLVGLFDGRDAVVGAMYQPITRELFWGDGSSAWYQRDDEEPRPLSVRPERPLSDSILATSWSGFYLQGRYRAGFESLAEEVRLLHYHGDCYLYGLLAMGQLDAVTDGGLSTYDILPLVPIVQGAGGTVVSGEGGDPLAGGFIVAASCEAVAQAVLTRLMR